MPGTFAGLMEKLDYLSDLGVNAIELMPIHEFNELEYYKVIKTSQMSSPVSYVGLFFSAAVTIYPPPMIYGRMFPLAAGRCSPTRGRIGSTSGATRRLDSWRQCRATRTQPHRAAPPRR